MKKSKIKPDQKFTQVTVNKSSNETIWIGGILALIAFFIYSNTLSHQYVMDDFATISGNKFVQAGFKGIPNILTSSYWFGLNENTIGIYRPSSLIMFAIEWQLSPNNPVISHWINVLLYALSGFILFFFIQKIAPNKDILFAFAVSLLWIVHPLHTEVVANIKSRDEILSFLFGILCLFQAIKYIESNHFRNAIWMCAFYVIALLSKESAITLTLIIPLTIYFFTAASRKQFIRLLLSIGICTVVYLIARIIILGNNVHDPAILVNDNSLVGAHSLNERFGTAIYILGYYLYKFFVPVSLASDYSYKQIPLTTFSNPLVLGSFFIYLSMGIYALKNIKQKTMMSFGIFYFFFAIALVSNLFILLRSTMGERFVYMPSLGICIIVIVLLFKIFGIKSESDSLFKRSGISSKVFLLAMIAVCVILSYKTYSRNKDWKDGLTLFTKDVQIVPENVKMKYFYAQAVMEDLKNKKSDPVRQKQKLESAISQIQQAIKIDPTYYLLYNTMGDIYNYQKEYQKAIASYRKTVDMNIGNPDVFGYLGNLYFHLQRFDSAAYYQSKAIAISPNSYIHYNNLGGAQCQLQNYEEAIKNFQKCIQLNPQYTEAYKNLGTAYSFTKRYEEAITTYNKALTLEPKNTTVLLYLGMVYENKGDPAKAEYYKNKAKALDPGIK